MSLFSRRTCCSNGAEVPVNTTPGLHGVGPASLLGVSWRLPGTDPVSGSWACGADSKSAIMTGAVGVTYNVSLQFVGVVEPKTYTGGSGSGSFQSGGSPAADVTNIYKLEVSDPAATYYINRGTSGGPCASINFAATIPIKTGASITLTADNGGDGRELMHSISVGGVTDPPQPYVGQWCNVAMNSAVPV